MDKKKTRSSKTAGLLCFFLGGVGAHNFYLGETAKGIAKIVITVASLALFIPSFTTISKYDACLLDLDMPCVTSMEKDFNNAKTLSTASNILSGALGIWVLIELVMIVKGGEAGMTKRGFNSANSANAHPQSTQQLVNMAPTGPNLGSSSQNPFANGIPGEQKPVDSQDQTPPITPGTITG